MTAVAIAAIKELGCEREEVKSAKAVAIIVIVVI
jgi:hypothetical protein